MANMNMIQALNSAMDIMLGKDPSVILMGEDIGYFGGVFRATEGLQRKYGEHRVIDTPIAEGGIVATAIGMSINGLRPVAEIQFADYIYPGFDQIVSELARIRYRSAGDFFAPVTIRTPCGGGIRGGQTHSLSPEGIFTHVSGIKVVPTMAQVAASGFTIRCRDVPKIAYTSNGRIAAYKPTTGSKPISSAYAMAVGKATAATDTPAITSCRNHSRRYPSKFCSPGATRRRGGNFLRAMDDPSIHPRSNTGLVIFAYRSSILFRHEVTVRYRGNIVVGVFLGSLGQLHLFV